MSRLVLTVIGDDRPGLVNALADVVSAHDGNWERSQLTQLAGKFAGIVVVAVPDDTSQQLVGALRRLEGLLEVAAYPGTEADANVADEQWRRVSIDLIGNDHPGIVRDVTAVIHRHNLSIDSIDTGTREAPWTGGPLFEAHVVLRLPRTADSAALSSDLEELANEILVDLTVEEQP
ncbi:MAG: glycine cleavage system protein R [Dermatophilaceae bacterium]